MYQDSECKRLAWLWSHVLECSAIRISISRSRKIFLKHDTLYAQLQQQLDTAGLRYLLFLFCERLKFRLQNHLLYFLSSLTLQYDKQKVREGKVWNPK